MRKPDTIIVDGRAYSWRQLCGLRQQQLEERRAAQGRQLALSGFPYLHDMIPSHRRSRFSCE